MIASQMKIPNLNFENNIQTTIITIQKAQANSFQNNIFQETTATKNNQQQNANKPPSEIQTTTTNETYSQNQSDDGSNMAWED